MCECACTAGAEFEKDDGRARPRDGRREAEAEAGSVNGMEESEKLTFTPPAAVSRCPADVAGRTPRRDPASSHTTQRLAPTCLAKASHDGSPSPLYAASGCFR